MKELFSDSSKGRHPILSHMCCIGGFGKIIVRKARGVGIGFCPESLVSVPKSGQKAVWNRDKRRNL